MDLQTVADCGSLDTLLFATLVATENHLAHRSGSVRKTHNNPRFRRLINDIYRGAIYDGGKLVKYFTAKTRIHNPKVDGVYVMRSDLRGEAGESVPADCYVIQARRVLWVIRT